MIKKYLFNLLLLLLLLFPILALFHPGLPITHDGQDHVARIANFYLNLTQGNFIPRWAPNLNWGYGHPILEFLYPFPSYIASLFHLIGFSLENSTKIVYGLGMVLSSIFMYLWLKQFLSKQSALLGTILYTYAPYRFVELYVRGDIGENLAFAFVPLVLFFVYKLYKSHKFNFIFLGSISLALLILSHNAISLMFVPIISVYSLLLVYISKERKRLFTDYVIVLFFGFAVAAFFWVPALIEGKYTLRNIVTAGGYISHFASIKSLIYGPWSYGGSGQFTVQFGIFQWFALLFSPFTFIWFKKNKLFKILILLLWLLTLISTFLMLKESNFIWSKFLLLQNFQFPWRFLAIIVFTTSVMGAMFIEAIPTRINKNIFLTGVIAIILIVSSIYAHPKAYQEKAEAFYSGIYYSTTDTGESAPIWSVRFMEHTPKKRLQVIDGRANVLNLKRTATMHSYKVDVSQKTLFAENTLYFPGWKILANKKTVDIQFQNMQYRGIMLFSLDPGQYTINVSYNETKLRLISDLASAFSFFVLLITFLLRFKRN